MADPQPPESTSNDLRTLAASHAERIERLFGQYGIGRLRQQHPEHPAIAEVNALRRFAGGAGVPIFEEIEFLSQFRCMLFEALYWPSGDDAGDPLSFAPTSTVRKHFASRLREPGSYGDTLAELFTWGRLASSGIAVTPWVAEPGYPDLRLTKADWSVVGDVKRLRAGSAVEAARRAIRKANAQIKAVAGPPLCGLAWVYIEMPFDRIALDDRVPSDVAPYVVAVTGVLDGNANKSVTAALLIWDDVIVMDDGTGGATYLFRRRCHVVNHGQPRVALPVDVNEFAPLAWFAAHIGHPSVIAPTSPGVPVPKPLITGQDAATIAFRQLSELGDGIHAGQALEVIADPDSIEVVENTVIIATRYVPARNRMLLVVATNRPTESRAISMAFWLPVSPEQARGTWSARDVLDTFLSRFGLLVRVNDEEALFHRALRISGTLADVAISVPDRGAGVMHAVLTPRDGFVEVIAAFAVDQTLYRSAVAAAANPAS